MSEEKRDFIEGGGKGREKGGEGGIAEKVVI